ncbi:hypothetical protein, partial [Pseudoalteromonas sp. BZP1]|uniref:hypothetical protein n=1 Tax=Pseudoalteromonas sp. BZP1 TaxID=3136671 RepID=UPI0032C40F27
RLITMIDNKEEKYLIWISDAELIEANNLIKEMSFVEGITQKLIELREKKIKNRIELPSSTLTVNKYGQLGLAI